MDKPLLHLSWQKLKKNSIFAFIQYVKESNFHYITISYLVGEKWKEERGLFFFPYKAILQNYLVIFFIKSVKILDTFLENGLILIVSFKEWFQFYIFV